MCPDCWINLFRLQCLQVCLHVWRILKLLYYSETELLCTEILHARAFDERERNYDLQSNLFRRLFLLFWVLQWRKMYAKVCPRLVLLLWILHFPVLQQRHKHLMSQYSRSPGNWVLADNDHGQGVHKWLFPKLTVCCR